MLRVEGDMNKGKNTLINKIISIDNREKQLILPKTIIKLGFVNSGHKIYRCLTGYDKQNIVREFLGPSPEKKFCMGDTIRMAFTANFVPEYERNLGMNLYYMVEGVFMSDSINALFKYVDCIYYGSRVRIVLTEKCLIKKSHR